MNNPITSACLILIASTTLAGCGSTTADPFADATLIDLTHAFDESTVYWPTAEGFKIHTEFQGDTEKGYYYTAKSFSTAEHGGTHIDSPIHFYKSRQYVDEIPLDTLTGLAVCIDVSEPCAADRDHQVTIADIAAWEAIHGRIPDRAIVMLRTGFGRHWPDRAKYMGTDERGPDAVAKLSFPGLHYEAADWLVKHRRVKLVGIDTPSIDYGKSKTFMSHVLLFRANVPALENVANLDKLPPTGFTIVALPMKIKGGSGGPTRIVAIIK